MKHLSIVISTAVVLALSGCGSDGSSGDDDADSGARTSANDDDDNDNDVSAETENDAGAEDDENDDDADVQDDASDERDDTTDDDTTDPADDDATDDPSGDDANSASSQSLQGTVLLLPEEADSEVLDDIGGVILSWTPGDEISIGTSPASLGDLPDGIEEIVGLFIDMGGGERVMNVYFPLPEDADPNNYAIVYETELDRIVMPGSPLNYKGQPVLTLGASTDLRLYMIEFHPPAGCDGVAAGGGFSSDDDLTALEGVFRSNAPLTIQGADVTTLESLDCLMYIHGPSNISDTSLETASGLDNLFAGGVTFQNNPSLRSVQLPVLWAGGLQVLDSPLLSTVEADTLNMSGVSLIGSSPEGLSLSFDSLETAYSVGLGDHPGQIDLDGFSALRRVSTISFSGNETMRDFEMNEVEAVDFLTVRANAELRNVELSGVTTGATHARDLSRSVDISLNPQLVSVDLSNMDSEREDEEAMDVHLLNNPKLEHLNMASVEQVTDLQFQTLGNTDEELTFDFSRLKQVELFLVEESPGIRHLAGFEALETIEDKFDIQNNTSLETLEDLQALDSVGGSLLVIGNPALQSAQFSSLSTVDYVEFRENETLVSLELPALQTIGTTFRVTNHPSLARFAADTLREATEISITKGGNLETELVLDFPKLESAGSLGVEDSDGLRNLDGLASLTSVVGLGLSGNTELVDVSGLSSLKTVEGGISFSAINLTDIELPALESATRFSLQAVGPERVNLPALESAGEIGVHAVMTLRELRADRLEELDTLQIVNSGINVDVEELTLSFERLETVNELLEVRLTNLLTLDGFPALRNVGTLDVATNSRLPACEIQKLNDRLTGAATDGSDCM